MSEPAFTSRVTLDKDGVYRWYYDLDMFRNRYLLNVMLKLTGAICAGVYFLLVLLLDEGGPLVAGEPWESLRTPFLLLLPFLGVMLLVITGYCIAAAVKRGKYRLQFEMTEERIRLVRKQSTQEFMNTAADVMSLVSANKGRALQTAAASGDTAFSSVLSVTERKKYDGIDLREFGAMNQIMVPPEDYDFVRDFILSHVPEKTRVKEQGVWSKRIGKACLSSLVLNLLVFLINLIAYRKTYNLLLFFVHKDWNRGEQWAFGMRNILTGYRGGGILRYNVMLAMLFFMLTAAVLLILLIIFEKMRKNSRGE